MMQSINGNRAPEALHSELESYWTNISNTAVYIQQGASN